MQNGTGATTLRFGVFEANLATGELRKAGVRIKLQDQPFQLLRVLLESPGEVVTRDDLRKRLWPEDTYVDFDRSLNTAASRLREALGDSASSPRFVETLPRRGYRFLATIESIREAGGGVPPPDAGAASRVSETATEFRSRERELTRRLRWAWLLAGAAVIVALGSLLVLLRTDPVRIPETPPRRFTVAPQGGFQGAAISPDGRYLVYPSHRHRALVVVDFESGEHRPLDDTKEAFFPFWSPDNEFIGFLADFELRKVAVEGGTAARICNLPTNIFNGGTWSPDGRSIVFGSDALYEVPARGGVPQVILSPDEVGESEIGTIRRPHFLPSETGRRVLVFAVRGDGGETLMVLDLESGRRIALGPGDDPFYSPSGHIVYQSNRPDHQLWAIPFSASTLTATGKAFPIAEDSRYPSVAADQTLVYAGHSNEEQQLAWFNRDGEMVGQIGEPQRRIRYPALSPDERWVAVSGWEGGSPDLWLHDVGHGVKNRLTASVTQEARPVWSSSGGEILYTLNRPGMNGVFRISAGSSGDAEQIYGTDDHEFASDLSRDSRFVLFDKNDGDIWYLERTSDGRYEGKSFLSTAHTEKAAHFSLDGEWVAYLSNESGQFEVYLRRFPDGSMKHRVSRNGGVGVRWSKDGRRLFYVADATLYEVEVTLHPEPTIGKPEPLFRLADLEVRSWSAYPHYDVSADGERFLIPVIKGIPVVHIVQNWFAEFRERR